jgi:hypothetical protein
MVPADRRLDRRSFRAAIANLPTMAKVFTLLHSIAQTTYQKTLYISFGLMVGSKLKHSLSQLLYAGLSLLSS